jgi:hypothetical protein
MKRLTNVSLNSGVLIALGFLLDFDPGSTLASPPRSKPSTVPGAWGHSYSHSGGTEP